MSFLIWFYLFLLGSNKAFHVFILNILENTMGQISNNYWMQIIQQRFGTLTWELTMIYSETYLTIYWLSLLMIGFGSGFTILPAI